MRLRSCTARERGLTGPVSEGGALRKPDSKAKNAPLPAEDRPRVGFPRFRLPSRRHASLANGQLKRILGDSVKNLEIS